MADVGQAVGKEDFDALVGIADTRVHGGEVAPGFGLVTGFLAQFAPRGVEDVLASVDLAGGQFEENPAQWMPILALEQQLAVFERGDHHHRARMHHHFADALAAVGQAHAVGTDVQQLALEYLFAGEGLFAQVFVHGASVTWSARGRRYTGT